MAVLGMGFDFAIVLAVRHGWQCENPLLELLRRCAGDKKLHHSIPLDMLKRLWYKGQYELPGYRNPRQSR